MTVPRRVVRRARWLWAPVALLGAILVIAPWDDPSPGDADRQFDAAQRLPDAKLRRTVSRAAAEPFSLDRLGEPGLPVEMLLDESEWLQLQSPRHVSRFRHADHPFALVVAGQPAIHAKYKIRGQRSLRRAIHTGQRRRLNFTVDLSAPVPVAPGVRLRDFYLQNLIFDEHRFMMRFSYLLLRDLGLFSAHNQFVRLSVNGGPVGLYLLVERPKDAIRRRYPRTTFVYRRLSSTERPYDVVHPLSVDDWRGGSLESLERAVRTLSGESLVAELNAALNLDAYLTWLGFNSLVRNPDSYDELFFFLPGESAGPPDRGRLEIMAWDYDQIMARRPAHPAASLEDPLLFASEGELDRAIQREPLLYARYREVLFALLRERLTPGRLRDALTTVRNELESIDLAAVGEDADHAARRLVLDEFETELLDRRAILLRELSP